MAVSDKNEHIKSILSIIPETPGVYQYFDQEGKIIYVGKAKNLKRRVHSYFNKLHDSPKTNILVRNICDIKYIVVNSEEDALHLENSLIKEYKPRYNVLLKDDKTYPWICVRNEHFSRVFLTRKAIKDGSKYYGPYSNVQMAKTVLEMIRSIYPIRTCKHALTPDNIRQHKFKICLQYHIKNCRGGCEGFESEEQYQKYITQVHHILNGDTSQLSTILRDEMEQLSKHLLFEEAQIIKEKYQLLENYRSKSVIVSMSIHNIDVYSYEENEEAAYINYMHIRNGSIVQSYTIEYRKRMEEAKEDILALGIAELRGRFKSPAREIIVPFKPNTASDDFAFLVPQRGDKKKLLEISQQNVKQYKVDRLKQAEKLNPDQRMIRILSRLQKDLNMKEMPLHIECFDNSNIQGTNPVASCVVFKKAKPSKNDYRHFNIKTVVGPDDYASMTEIVYRRYKRLLDESQPLPQLIIIDGGKGQLHAAVTPLRELGLTRQITIVGIAKRLEEIYFPDDPYPLCLDKNSESLRLIQQLRDEAHRFGITHHRNRRSKSQTVSFLDGIKGIGEKSRELLLKHFKSLKRIQNASQQEIAGVVGESKAELILNALNTQKT